jgi:hypothetical protein
MADHKQEVDPVLQLPFPTYEPEALGFQTPHPKDPTIEFEEESHVYRCRFADHEPFEEHCIVSTSGIVHKHFPHFDPDNVIQKMMRSRNWSKSKYFSMCADDIKALWNENGRVASERGTLLHYLLECHNNGFDLAQAPQYSELPDIKAYFKWRKLYFEAENLVPFRTEMRMRTGRDLRITGTADLLAIKDDHPPPSETGGVLTLHMIDWKFSKGIQKENRYEQGHGPCAKMPNCNYSHYLLQQNLYKWLLETYYSTWSWRGQTYTRLDIATKHLAIFHKNHGDDGYLYMPLPDCTDTITDIINCRRQEVARLLEKKRKRITVG